MHVDDPQHYDAFLCPGEKLYSVTAAHTRWLSKEGQVVVPSAAQSSVDAAHADICLPRSLQGEKKSAFPYACTHCNSSLHPPPLPHSAAPPSFPQSQPDGSLNIVYHGLQSQMQTVSIGIPILPSQFPLLRFSSSAKLRSCTQVAITLTCSSEHTIS